ncbi:hypothetical protein [Kitasatospora purpeofusca]|uniref:hypothetical protein n=1 Tax=Kitasatospora purpeofusca TaxID=67352 RepID=UPI0037F6F8E7
MTTTADPAAGPPVPPRPDQPPTVVDLTKTTPVAADQAADADGPLAAHLRRAGTRTAAWLRTEDLTTEDMATAVLDDRRRQHQARETQLRQELARISSQIVTAKRTETSRTDNDVHRDGDEVVRLKGQRELVQAQLAEHQETTKAGNQTPPSDAEMSRARWGRKAGRAAALVGGVVGGGVVLPMQDLRLLALSLPAAAVALWRAGARAEEHTAQPQGPAVSHLPAPPGPADRIAQAAAGQPSAPAGEPVNPFADQVAPATPEERAQAAATAEAQIMGAKELLDHLVDARVIAAGKEREQARVLELRTDGPGWTAVVEMPPGRFAEQAVGCLQAIASTLKVKASRIELSKDTTEEGHEGRFRMWVADVDNPYGGTPVPSELINAESWDFWRDGIPLGADARQVRRILHLLWSSMMIGGLQRYGKSFLARLIAAAAALDPHVRIVLICGKVSADWAPLKKVAHAYVAGNSEDKVIEAYRTVTDLIAHLQDIGAKMEALSETDPEACPEGKITPELAKDPSYGLTLLVVDELQTLIGAAERVKDEDSRKSYGALLVDQLGTYNRLTSSAGGMAIGVTQRPGADSVPTVLRDSYVARASFRVKGVTTAEMVLGKPAVDAGAAPHLLLEHHKGVAVVDLGEDAGHFTIKADMITIPQFREICERGQQLRVQAGTLTGYARRTREAEQNRVAQAAQAAAARAVHDRLLSDALGVMDDQKVDRMRSEPLLAALAQARPDAYAEWKVTQLTDALRDAGAGQTERLGPWDGMANPRGYLRQQIADALTS